MAKFSNLCATLRQENSGEEIEVFEVFKILKTSKTSKTAIDNFISDH
jgi:hypothetical protein